MCGSRRRKIFRFRVGGKDHEWCASLDEQLNGGGEEQDDVPENDAGRRKQSLMSPEVNDEADLKQEIQISSKGQDKITLKPLLPQRLVQIPIVT